MRCFIEVNGLKLHCYHGVLTEERTHGNLYVVDLKVEASCEEAMATDSLDSTINYATLCEIITREMLIPSALLENVAYRIIQSISKEFSINSGYLKISKIVPPINAVVDSCSFAVEW